MLYLRHKTAELMVNRYFNCKCALFTTLNNYRYVYGLCRSIIYDYNKIYMNEKYRYYMYNDSSGDSSGDSSEED